MFIKMFRRVQILQTAAQERFDERFSRPVAYRRFICVQFHNQIVYTEAEERGADMFDRMHAGSVGAERSAAYNADDILDSGWQTRFFRQVRTHEGDTAVCRCGQELESAAVAGMQADTCIHSFSADSFLVLRVTHLKRGYL